MFVILAPYRERSRRTAVNSRIVSSQTNHSLRKNTPGLSKHTLNGANAGETGQDIDLVVRFVDVYPCSVDIHSSCH